jgi:hypothetical protein
LLGGPYFLADDFLSDSSDGALANAEKRAKREAEYWARVLKEIKRRQTEKAASSS